MVALVEKMWVYFPQEINERVVWGGYDDKHPVIEYNEHWEARTLAEVVVPYFPSYVGDPLVMQIRVFGADGVDGLCWIKPEWVQPVLIDVFKDYHPGYLDPDSPKEQ